MTDQQIPQISDDCVEKLTAPFTLDEIKDVVFNMKKNKSPGPDGLPAEFYQQFWEVVKWDTKDLLDDFHKGCLILTDSTMGLSPWFLK